MPKAKRTRRSASQKLNMLRYMDRNGPKATADHFKVVQSQLYKWGQQRADLEAAAKLEPVRTNVDLPPAKVRAASRSVTPPDDPRETIVGLGLMISQVRAVVIEEIAAKVGELLAPMIDARMPDIVSQELRKLLGGSSNKEAKVETTTFPQARLKSV